MCFAAACLAFQLPASAAQFIVNSARDGVDANPGDGLCATAAGDCTLRAAIQESNALPGADVIFVPGAVYTLTIPGTGEDAAATGDLDITEAPHGPGRRDQRPRSWTALASTEPLSNSCNNCQGNDQGHDGSERKCRRRLRGRHL